MAQSIPPAMNAPTPTCSHKACSECTTAWNVCCECLSCGSGHLMRWNIAGLPLLFRGDMQRRYCAPCYVHWRGRVRTTNDYPRALEVTPSHPLRPAAQQSRRPAVEQSHIPAVQQSHISAVQQSHIPAVQQSVIPVANLSGRLSSSARRRMRRMNKGPPGSNIATRHTTLPDEMVSWTAGGPSATPAPPSVRPLVEEPVREPVILPLMVVAPRVRSTVPVQLSPAEQRDRFRLFTEDRISQISALALTRRTRNLEQETLRSASGGHSVTARPRPARSLVAADYDTYHWDFFGMANRPRGPQAGGPADVSAVESSWALMTPIDPTTAIDTWDTDLELLSTVTDPSDVAETARHASRLLDAFSSGNIEGPLSSTQQRLLSTALTSILALTHDRVDTAAQTDPLPPPVDAAAQTDPLPPPVDVSMRPDATCVVCFARLVDTVLVPCWHLVLCAECCAEMKRRARPSAMQCPVCRRVVRKTPKVFRS